MSLDSSSLTNFTDLSNNNKLMVLEWRNSVGVRKWMYDSGIISVKDHLAFISALKENVTKQYFLVSYKNNYIGVIYFIDIDRTSKKSEFGIYSNPDLKGNGKILMDCICTYGFQTLNLQKIIAEVFIDNQRAINLYKHYGFKKIDENYLNNKKIIHMEAKNADR